MNRYAFASLFVCLIVGITAAALAQAPSNPPGSSAGNAQPSPPTTPPPTTPSNSGSGGQGGSPQLPAKLTDEDKAAIKKLLGEIVTTSDDHPVHIICSAKDPKNLNCTPPSIFVSSSAISIIEITDISAQLSLAVRITSGELDDVSGAPLFVERFYSAPVPDTIFIAVNRARRFNRTYQDRDANRFTQKVNDAAMTSVDFSIPFLSLSRSGLMGVQLIIDDGASETFKIPLNYQHWFVDTGGFLTFGVVADQELAVEDAGSGNVRVIKKRSKDKLVPGTGIVLNFHPANYPGLAAQFGLATSVDRAASYYLGIGYRLRELGPKTLATFAVGLAATQVKRFPDVSVGDVHPATADSITKGSSRYAFGPYLSLSLGFSFGGNDTPTAAPVSSTTPTGH